MEDLHNLLRLHHLSEAVKERVYCFEVNQEASVCEVDLDQLHASVLSETFAVDSQDWSLALVALCSVHNGCG